MGGSASTHVGVFPVYYVAGVTDAVSEQDIVLATESWKMLQDNTAPSWLRRKEVVDDEGAEQSHLVWLMDSFYARLFDTSPSSKALFKNSMKAQGRALIGMLNTAVSVLRSPEKLVPALEDLARRHAKYGVVAQQYGIVGEVLIWSLGYVLEESFTDQVKTAWLKIYCLMLKFIIPAALAEEQRLKTNPSEEESEIMTLRLKGLSDMLSAATATAAAATTTADTAAAATTATTATTTGGDSGSATTEEN